MRIISGKYKGKKLFSPNGEDVRPTQDKVKQAMFTKLQFDIAGAKVLDLFCGSGAIGIEALSRGAEKVVMNDKELSSIKIVKKNLSGLSENPIILNLDYKAVLEKLNEKFDLIFIDPPYAHHQAYEKCLKIIKERTLLSDKGIIVCEHFVDYKIKNEEFYLFDQKKYGTVLLSYFKYKLN